MDELITQQQIQQDLSTFDIDDYLMEKKEKLDKRIQQYHIKIQALKIARGYTK
jgi:hypothetical protein